MPQNKNQIIKRFIGNLSNAILHQILEEAIDDQDICGKYNKEVQTSWDIAKEYRGKINPKNEALPENDVTEIREKTMGKVKAELRIRESKGYENIDFDKIESFVDKALRSMKVIA